ncbi:MAG: hypothetical protein H6557_23315 [Lewinellaceae bacterium]|nr:hypothetical protein [Lewinellaceae bacterium]
MKNNEEIQLYLKQDINSLYANLVDYSPIEGLFEPEQKIKIGKDLWGQLKKKIFNKLCIECDLVKKIDDPKINDATSLIIIIADLISSFTGGFPVFFSFHNYLQDRYSRIL